jgi:hypothetical protein
MRQAVPDPQATFAFCIANDRSSFDFGQSQPAGLKISIFVSRFSV